MPWRLPMAAVGYSMPVVDFDFPDDPNGTIAKAHADIDASGAITEVVVDDPGSGYSVAPNVVIRDGPIYAPLNNRALNAAYAARARVIERKKAGPLSLAEVNAIGPAATTEPQPRRPSRSCPSQWTRSGQATLRSHRRHH